MSTNRTEITGKTVEAATQEAEQRFARDRGHLDIQVLSQGSRGVFGLGGEPARILVREPAAPVINPTPYDEPPDPSPSAREAKPARRAESERAPSASAGTAAPISPPSRPVTWTTRTGNGAEGAEEARPELAPQAVGAVARQIVDELLTKMGVEAEVRLRSVDDPVTLDVTGENLGILIGRRGDSLASLQFMVNVILSKRFHQWPRVVIDVQGYRARREQSLNSLGLRVADRVRHNRRPFTLEAMPANDRRVIHLALRDRSDVETYSIGEGPGRRVVIAPKR